MSDTGRSDDSDKPLVIDDGEPPKDGEVDAGDEVGTDAATAMGPPPPKTYHCLQPDCEKRYTRVQDLLGHYNTKHRDVEIPLGIYKWKQEQDAKPKVECPHCHKFFAQNVNR